MKSILVLMTCHNRALSTRQAIVSGNASAVYSGSKMHWSIVDDGSTDQTSSYITSNCSNLTLNRGSGNLFWNGGMKLAWEEGRLDVPDADYVLWLNDDVVLEITALELLIGTIEKNQVEIAVGACTSKSNRSLVTYGGYKKVGFLPSKLQRVLPQNEPQIVDTFNGNVVLMKSLVMETIGFNNFKHGYGDILFGLQAKQLGFRAILIPEIVGFCENSMPTPVWLDKSRPLRERMRYLFSPKGLPRKDHLLFYSSVLGKFIGYPIGIMSLSRQIVRTLLVKGTKWKR